MALINWTDEFKTGIESVDNQHRKLVEIVNKFDEASKKGKGSRIMNEILNDLIGYTTEHFVDEEKLMEDAGYDKLNQHKSQHRQLLQKVERLQFEFDQQGKRITSDVREFLKYWLINHILIEDKAYVSAVTQKV
jgi:hemerythrin-like metal-binding protein